jgi:murein DD-endopeptidase MepM/ murein hydrolase activator NlpD
MFRAFAWLLPALALPLLLACGDRASGVLVSIPTATPEPPSPTIDPYATPLPPPELILSTEDVYQGGAVLVSLVGNVRSGSVSFLGRTSPLMQGARSIFTFMPVSTGDETGDHELRVDFKLQNGTEGTILETVRVIPTRWTVDSVNFTQSQTNAYLDSEVRGIELDFLEDMYSLRTPKKLWDTPWLIPSGGIISARFGEQRSINGAPPTGNHGGTDFGAPEGAPVVATNHGRVIMARQLDLRGNMIIIDHGGGVLSGYAHLSAFSVAEGQDVDAGDLIGYVGNTGLSTGAHLHWEMVINGVFVDGLRFIDGTNGF